MERVIEHIKDDRYVVKTSVIDPQTGEVVLDRRSLKWSGWKDGAYRYRVKAKPLKFYMDMDWDDLTSPDLNVLFMLCKMIDNNNLFIQKTDNWYLKYFGKRYKAMTKQEIYDNIPEIPGKKKISIFTFKKIWKHLTKKYIKKIKVDGESVWAVNPAFISKTEYIPLYLYTPFKEWLEPFISESARKKFQNMEIENWNGEHEI